MEEQPWPSHMQISHVLRPIVAHEEHLCCIAQGNSKACPHNMTGTDAKTPDTLYALHSFLEKILEGTSSVLDVAWQEALYIYCFYTSDE